MFQTRLKEDAEAARACLHGAIPGTGALAGAMRYATAGGKGIRAFLVMESARLFGVGPARSVLCAAAIEAIHGYSLVHDDLPCMDDDDLRRGLPTVHRKWDEATAVLVGDALHSLAFELLARKAVGPAKTRIALTGSLAAAAGGAGMVHGQMLDIAAESAAGPLTLAQITELQAGKTGALILWSATAGAVLAGEDPAPLATFAADLGLAFQIADDILDIEGDAETMGKAVGKDEGAGKATFVSLMGLEPARARARALIDEACGALAPYGAAAETLREAARFVISRKA